MTSPDKPGSVPAPDGASKPTLSIDEQLELIGDEELHRYRKLDPTWSAIFYGVTIISTLLAMNQMFNLGFLIGFTVIENQYLYLMAAVLLPLVFVTIPAHDQRVLPPKILWYNCALAVLSLAAVVGVSVYGGLFQYPVLAAVLLAVLLAMPRLIGRRLPGMEDVPWYDVVLAVTTFVTLCHFVANSNRILEEAWEYTAPNTAIGFSVVLWALFIEIGRRTGGWTIFWITIVWSLFPVYADQLPEIIQGVSQDFWTTAAFHMMSVESFLGAPMQAFAGLIFGFLIFGVAMQYTGAGSFFINIAFAITGTMKGGPAKTAVFSSGLFGSMSGSAVSNVLTTGPMTIPAMIKVGFTPKVAAAIEANAATGGTLMPPVMGATAFVMAAFLGVPYGDVALAAALPSLLYYYGLLVQVDCYANKYNLEGIPRSEAPSIWQSIKDGWYFCFAFAILVWMLLWLQRESTAPFYATAALLVINQFTKHRMDLAKFKKFLYGSGILFVELCGVLAPIGLMIGALTITGMVGTLTNDLVFIAGGSTLLLLIMGAITSFILGLGLTSTACYIFLAVILAPALEKAGLDRMAVHMFLLYWGMVSLITPPVALAAFAAAGLAKANPWETGMVACKLGMIIYFIPFFFVYNTSLMMTGPALDIVLSLLTSLIGIYIVGAALQDYMRGFGILGSSILGYLGRIVIFCGGMIIAAPEEMFDVNRFVLTGMGVAGAAAGVAICKLGHRVFPRARPARPA